ncbi:serine recombinase [Geomonas silvestris]|uniref:Serine recombinase n=1 Tax=Geomonas silvestris TaxID=2740184 RepID=A0A6V8MH45_9BACT|nr:serine recombinase [Geomonas silvestris]
MKGKNISGGSKTRAVNYVRVSSKEQKEEGFSLPAQLQLLHDYAQANGIEIVCEYVDVESAKGHGRKEFNKMLEFLDDRTNNCHTILVEKVDRLVRNLYDAGMLLEEYKAEIHFVKEHEVITPNSPSAKKLMCGFKVLMAKNVVDNLSEEVVKGMTQKAKEGMWPSQAPLGYENAVGPDKKKIIIPDPVRAPFIKAIFQWYATGMYSMSDIVKKAYNDGFRCRDNTGKVCKSLIEKILKNPIYCGEFVWKGETYKGVYEAIISKDLFDKVQDTIQGKASRPSKPLKHFFAFQGMVTCAKCGCAMVAELKKERYIYYHCTQNRGKCSGKCVREEVLDLEFLKAIEAITLDSDVVEWIVGVMRETEGDKRRYHEERLAALATQRRKVEGRLDSIYTDKLDGVITPEQFVRYSEKFKGELREIDNSIRGHQYPNHKYLDDATRLLELAQNGARLYSTQNMEEKRRVLRLVHSNSTWDEGKLVPNLRKPFDIIAVTNKAYKEKKVTFPEENDLSEFWLPNPDSNQGHGD